MFARLAGAGFGPAVVETEPVDFAQAGDERREIFDGEQALLAFEAPRHQQHMPGKQVELIQQHVVRGREVGYE